MTGENFEVPVADAVLRGTRWTGPDPAVVLLHAGVCDRRSWAGVADRLSPAHAVVAYDRRGYGSTEPGSATFTHVQDLIEVLDAVTDGPVWLVGSSAGGALAIDTALLEPQRVAGLVLLAPAVSGAPEPSGYDAASQRLSDLIDAAHAAGDLAEVNRLTVRAWLDGPASPEGRVGGQARDLALDMNAVAQDSELPEGAGKGSVDAWARLEELGMPVTVACGDLDVPYLLDRSAQIAGRLPEARAVVLPGMAHLPFLERPDLVAQVITEAIAAASG